MENRPYELREEYRYFAFISYSHKDTLWAKWLQKKLENYRLPVQLRRRHIDLPPKLSPVFRDETDLAGAVLNEALYREVARSQYLIVICSPNSTGSSYVNREVEYFRTLGRQNRIIPFVVSGEPFSDDPWKECLPLAIRNIRPVLLGIDAQKHGKKTAFSHLVATLLRLPADEVIMRERKRERFRKTIASVAAAVLVLAAGVTAWNLTEHSAYYNAYTYKNEIPQGLYRLTKIQREKMSESYRITTRGGKVVRLETVNSAGVATESIIGNVTTEYPVMEFGYDERGRLITVTQCNEAGVAVYKKKLDYAADGRTVIEFTNPSTAEAVGMSVIRINRHYNTYNADGLLVQSMFYWYNTFHPTCNENGVYGRAYTYNSAGQIATISNLDQNGEILNCRYGWSTIVLEYDSRGNVISESYYASDGSKAITEKGYHEMQLFYDSHGNVEEMLYVNPEGQPCNTDSGFCRQIFERNSKGFMTGAKIYTAQGVPATNKDGTHERIYEYDQNGRMSYIALLDGQGKPVANPSLGYASVGRVYDQEGNKVEEWLYDEEGQVIYAEKFYYVDGKQVKAVYEDEDGNRISPYGYCICEYGYDEHGNRSREDYYDTDGRRVLTSKGYASRELDYDEFGNVLEIRCYGIDEKLCIIHSGYAVARYSYTDGLPTGVKYYGVAENPVLYADSYHECRMTYNEIGVCTRMEYYGTDGNLIITAEGYAIVEQDCDMFGNVTEIRYFGEQAEPILLNGSHHKVKYQFDSHNNTTHIWYYGTDGKLIMGSDGYAAAERDFDAYGDTIAWRYYGEQNEPILYKGQYHELRYLRDAYRNFTHTWYYGTDGNLISVDGYAAAEMERDAEGNYLSIRYFGTMNEPILLDGEYHEIRLEYDDQGNAVRTEYYGTDGKMRLRSQGYAAIERDYDGAGNVLAQRYYGTQNEPILLDGEYHEIRLEYDDQGNAVRTEYYGTDGKMRLRSKGYAVIENEYDDAGNTIAERYYGTQNEPILLDGEYHEIRLEYDDQGNAVRTEYYGTDGKMRLISQGYAAIERDYDGAGNVLARRYYGTQNEPVLVNGIYEVCWIYDAKGNQIGARAYDTQGNLVDEIFYDN